ncbi:MAG: hypothetical protein AAF513_02070 [Pseudomonadota bacterium]
MNQSSPPEPGEADQEQEVSLGQTIARYSYKTMRWGRDKVPPGIRSIVGVGLMIGGVFGFLPILGFWMFPLGLAFIALDLPFMRPRIDRWIDSLSSRAYPEDTPADASERSDG